MSEEGAPIKITDIQEGARGVLEHYAELEQWKKGDEARFRPDLEAATHDDNEYAAREDVLNMVHEGSEDLFLNFWREEVDDSVKAGILEELGKQGRADVLALLKRYGY